MRRSLIVVCIMLSLFMSAIEVTIVATAMPQIVRDLGGFAYYSWVFSAFLLTQTATTVIFGKLADIYGRKPVIIAGTVIFLTGSVLCGFAWSMGSMIAFRLLQGVGRGFDAVHRRDDRGRPLCRARAAADAGRAVRRLGGCGDGRARSSAACWSSTCRGRGSSGSTCRSAS